MAAEFLLKKYLHKNKIYDYEIQSAGINCRPFGLPYPETLERLKFYGCDARNHTKQVINKNLIGRFDLIICMTKHQLEYLKRINPESNSILYNEIAFDKKEDILDEAEYGEINGFDFDLKDYIYSIVDYIHNSIPLVAKKLDKFIK